MKKILTTALISAFLMSGMAYSQQGPLTIHAGKTTFITGGIGETEADAMRKAAADFPLALVLSRSDRGSYITGVKLRVAAEDGAPIVESGIAGPIVLLQLPEGHYQIEAVYDGETLTRDVEVDPADNRMIYLNWPA